MNQLTIRGFDDELASRIRQLATREGISLNRAVLRLLRRWTSEEAAEMDRALEDLSYVDEAIRMTGTSGRSMGSHGYTSPPHEAGGGGSRGRPRNPENLFDERRICAVASDPDTTARQRARVSRVNPYSDLSAASSVLISWIAVNNDPFEREWPIPGRNTISAVP